MRELTARIRFTSHSLGNQKQPKNSGRFVFSRSNTTDQILFLPSWHAANMRFAARLLARHQSEVRKIQWDINVDGVLREDPWFRLYYTSSKSKQRRYAVHEAFFPGQEVGINCCVPDAITDDDFWWLLSRSGQYRGLSPWKPGEYGHFELVSLRPRKAPQKEDDFEPPVGVPVDRSKKEDPIKS